MTTRFACLLVEHLPTRVEALLDPELTAAPLVVLRPWDERVLDACPAAGEAGVGPGDSRQRVAQLCPKATVLPAREALYGSYHDVLLAILRNFADAVEVCALGEFFVEIGALARTFPSERALALQLATHAQQATRLGPTLGIAANKFTAAQAARRLHRGDAESAEKAGNNSANSASLQCNLPSPIRIVPPGKERAFLAPLPLTVLPDPPGELLRRLHLFGITRLGGFARLPQAAVVRQFGPEVAVHHDLARGADHRSLAPESPPPTVTRTLALPDALADRRLLLNGLERLAKKIAAELNASGYHATGLTLIVLPEDGKEHMTGAALKPPTADARRLQRMAGRLLGKLELRQPVLGLTLTAYPLRQWHLGVRQLDMFESALHPRLVRLTETLRLLRQRFGEAVVRLANAVGPPVPLPVRVQTRADGAPGVVRWGDSQRRTAALDCGSRRVARVYEYWREQRNWWDRLVLRDYYQVEAEGGMVFTVFRDGEGRWFMDRRRE